MILKTSSSTQRSLLEHSHLSLPPLLSSCLVHLIQGLSLWLRLTLESHFFLPQPRSTHWDNDVP